MAGWHTVEPSSATLPIANQPTLRHNRRQTVLYQLNLQDGSSKLVLSIADVIRASGDARLVGKRTWFNHVLFNTDGTRLLFFFVEYVRKTGFYTSLWTVNPDGSDLEMQNSVRLSRVTFSIGGTPTRILVSSDIVDEMGFVEFYRWYARFLRLSDAVFYHTMATPLFHLTGSGYCVIHIHEVPNG